MPSLVGKRGGWIAPLRGVRTGVLRPSGRPVLELTNAQKLALPRATPVGTRVRVTDSFVVSEAGAAGALGFYAPYGEVNSHVAYSVNGRNPAGNDALFRAEWVDTGEGFGWALLNGNDGPFYYSTEAVDFPWQVTTWTVVSGSPGPALANPPLQQLAAPSSAVGGMFVSGCGQASLIGIFTGPDAGVFTILGGTSTLAETSLGNGEWALTIGGDFSPTYIVTNPVPGRAANDPANVWGGDGLEPFPTVESVTEGELAAAVDPDGAGSAEVNKTNRLASPRNGFPGYGDPDNDGVSVLATYWQVLYDGGSGYYLSPATAPFPWGLTYTPDIGTPPAPTLYQNNVATEENWQTI